jgi:hypothetical protein
MHSLFAVLTMCIASSTVSAADTNAPILKVDSKHQMMNYPSGTKPESYRVRVSSNIILDATGYTFDVPLEIRDKPLNSVQVVQSKFQKYELVWQLGRTRYELSKATLKPLPGSEPFAGFKAGDHMIVAIGVTYPPKSFAPVWVGIVDVK